MTQEPVVVLPGGRQVRCAFCRNDLRQVWDTPGRQHAGHVGSRFGDNAIGVWRVTLDNDDVTNRCCEALSQRDGWVILYVEPEPGKRVLCSVGKDHALAELVHGNVEITRRAA